MERWNLEKEYQRLLQRSIARGEVSIRTDGHDQRQSPRIRMAGERVAVRLETEFEVLNISAGGFAFLSEAPFHEGETLHVVLKDAMAFQGQVVACQVVETDALLMELRYRVQCRFLNDTSGKQLLVLMQEMQHLGGDPSAT